LDPTGLLNNIYSSAANIDRGRKYLATDGHERTGRILYEDGISATLKTFKSAHAAADPHTMVLVELTFLRQELQFCDEADTITHSSLTQAIQSFEDALRSLKVVEDSTLYRGAEATYPTASKYR
jgi:hypothetical protein